MTHDTIMDEKNMTWLVMADDNALLVYRVNHGDDWPVSSALRCSLLLVLFRVVPSRGSRAIAVGGVLIWTRGAR